MAVERGWFIRSKEPNNYFWSLRADCENGFTTDPSKAILFARRIDAETYFDHHFAPHVRDQFYVMGVN